MTVLLWGIASAGKISHDFTTAIKMAGPDHEVVAVAARKLESEGINKLSQPGLYVASCHKKLREEIKFGGMHVQASFGYSMYEKERISDIKLGGGALLDIGCYPIVFSQMIFGERPERIVASGTFRKGELDCPLMTHDMTLTYAEIFDEILKQLGVVYEVQNWHYGVSISTLKEW